jgi:magnesium-transporting ATPase (P-type)
MIRGSSLKITTWIYGIVVYTGKETKIKQNENENKPQKRSQVEH